MRLDLLSLRIFLTVVEEGNLTRAAEREHIAASAISKRIQDLESVFETRLLTRNVRGVVPTAAGTTLARRARAVLGDLDQIRIELGEFAAGKVGRIAVRANGSAIVGFLASDLAAFGRLHAGLKVDVQECLSPEIARSVGKGLADLGVCVPTLPVPDGLMVCPYRTDRLLAVVPKDHLLAVRSGVSFAELLEFDQIGVVDGSSLSQLLLDAVEQLQGNIRFSCVGATSEVARWMVGAGFGVAVLPEALVRPYEALLGIRGVPIHESWAVRQLSIVARAPRDMTEPSRRLLEFLCGSEARQIESGDAIEHGRDLASV